MNEKTKEVTRKKQVRRQTMKVRNNFKGITLIALVVTIVVLLILAGVAIATLTGENGLLSKANEAKEETIIGEETEKVETAYVSAAIEAVTKNDGVVTKTALENELNKLTGNGKTSVTENGENNFDVYFNETKHNYNVDNGKVAKIEPDTSEFGIIKQEGEYTTSNTTAKDKNGDIVVIPKGFKIAKDSGNSVIEGIVIEDDDVIGEGTGNQYVWVPVTKDENGDATAPYSETGTLADGTEIKLSRYTFDEDGNPTDKGDEFIAEYSWGGFGVTPVWYINENEENVASFKLSVAENGGYYIARYEASYGADGKANSKVSQTTSNDIDELEEGTLWNYITQTDSITASQNLYLETKSELINSYAYDTALLYIEKCSGNGKYARNTALNSTLLNTGECNDEMCKINDMAGNLGEWTTESAYWKTSSSGSTAGCVCRGARYSQPSYYASFRGPNSYTYAVLPTDTAEDMGFRVILYI